MELRKCIRTVARMSQDFDKPSYLSASGNPAGLSWAWDVRLYRHQHRISPNTSSATNTSSRYALTTAPFYSPSAGSRSSIASSAARSTTKSSSNNGKPTGHSQQPTSTAAPEGTRGNRARDLLDMGWTWWARWSWCLCLWGGGGVFRRSKNPSNRHYQLQLGPYKQKHTTDKPSITKPDSIRHAGKAGGLMFILNMMS